MDGLERSAVAKPFSLRRLFPLLPILLLGAPALAAEPDGRPYVSTSYDAWRDEDYRYRIGAGDEIALRFMLNPDLNTAVVIGPDGRGVFPMIGSFKLTGLTAEEADRALTAAYGSVLRNPQVEALVTTYSSAQIYVGGEVKEPGVKTIKGQITITQAIMAAGGFSDAAKTGKVVVLRQNPGDPRPRMRVVNVGAVLHGGDGGDALLTPGDVVFAPRSSIGEVDLFVKQYMTDLIPFSFSYGFSANGR
jgi:protein involved in polysaccharide export with SLBB domain